MRIVTLSNVDGSNPFNLCILGSNKTEPMDVVDGIRSILMRDRYNDGCKYHIEVIPAKYGDYFVVVTTDEYIEPVCTFMAQINHVPMFGT